MKPLLVYVAGPYTPTDMSNIDAAQHELEMNIRRAVAVAERVLAKGHIPFIPHTHTQGYALRARKCYRGAKANELFYSWDNVILERCDAIVQYAPSPGADNEYALAAKLGLLLYKNVEDLPDAVHS